MCIRDSNDTTLGLIREITLINLKGVLNKDDFYRTLLTEYEHEIIDNMENLKEEDFSWTFGETGTSDIETSSKELNKSNFFLY